MLYSCKGYGLISCTQPIGFCGGSEKDFCDGFDNDLSPVNQRTLVDGSDAGVEKDFRDDFGFYSLTVNQHTLVDDSDAGFGMDSSSS